MRSKVGPAAIGIAVVILIAFCIFMYIRANNAVAPRQEPPSNVPFRPPYGGGGSNAGPGNNSTSGKSQSPTPGSTH